MSKKEDRARRDQAGVGPDPETARRHGLVPMHELEDFSFAAGEPDIRGWQVRTTADGEIGEIEELLVDPDRGEVVMVEVGLREGGVHAEVPIRSVQLDRSSRSVIIDSGELGTRGGRQTSDRLTSERVDARDRAATEPGRAGYSAQDAQRTADTVSKKADQSKRNMNP